MGINGERLIKRIEALALIGQNPEGGMDRAFGSEEDIKARKWLCDLAEEISYRNRDRWQFSKKVDAIGNLWFRWQPPSKSQKYITIGSHHDAVPDGGKYDGPLGVLLGFEVVETIMEQGLDFQHPLQVVSFTAEEPNPFNLSTMGSRTVTGKISEQLLSEAKSFLTGQSLKEAIAKVGGDIHKIDEAQVTGDDMAAFIECHIEQGRNLIDRHIPAGVVASITGIYREQIVLKGEANHAGTTNMGHRKDALVASASFISRFDEIIRSFDQPYIVGTIGKFDIYPNAANIIPGSTEFIMEIRVPDQGTKEQVLSKISEMVSNVTKEFGVIIDRTVILNQREVTMDEKIQLALARGISTAQGSLDEIGLKGLDGLEGAPKLVSMAGHDAVHMSDLTPTGMLFVASVDGKSHCREEFSRKEDIQIAGDGLLSAIISIDNEVA